MRWWINLNKLTWSLKLIYLEGLNDLFNIIVCILLIDLYR